MVETIDSRYTYGGQPVSEGGQARVYKGFDHDTGLPVAVKLFDLGDRDIDDVHLATWQLELKAYQSLPEHDHLTRVRAYGKSDNGIPYLVLEWLDGDLLDALPTMDIGGWDDFWPIARDILSGLSVIHRHGYIHRDIKPKNILLTQDKRYKVADFGTVRLRPESNFVNTFAFHGSQPFSAPEFGTLQPTTAYDVYSFAVLVTACLSSANLVTPHDVLEAFNGLDLPDDIRRQLEQCLAFAPEDRPQSATILLKQLSTIQAMRAESPAQKHRIHLEVPASVLSYYSQLVSDSSASIDDLLSDLRGAARFEIDKSAGSNGDIRIAGSSIVVSATVVGSRPWQLRVRKVVRPFRRHLDDAHQTWWKPKVVLSLGVPSDPPGTAQILNAFMSALHEFEATQLAAREGKEPNLFARLSRILDANEHLTKNSQRSIRFSAARRQGRRVYLRVEPGLEIVPNEGRLIRDAFKQKLFCEVETLTNQELVLYITRGELRELPQTGLLEIDTELTKSKLRRERAALDAVRLGQSSRVDLGDLLLAPQNARVATGNPASLAFTNPDIDDDKKLAVAKSIDLKDLLLVEGPPGTGKTTYIAELIGQQLAKSPGSKILLAAQTHIALDNALARVQEQNPSARFLRIGSVAKLDSASEPWSIPAQLALWREESIQLGRAFIRSRAERLGVSSADDSTEQVAAQLEAGLQRAAVLSQQRNEILTRRQAVRSQIAERDAQIKRVLDHLESLEKTALLTDQRELDSQIDELLDRGLSLVAIMEANGNLGVNLLAADTQAERSESELRVLTSENSRRIATLASALGDESTGTPEEMIASVLSLNVGSRKQIAQLEEILADWAARLDTDNSLHAVLLARADIVATTCVALTGVKGAAEVPFDLCLVDEASKASSTELLVPMANSKRWILVGDDKQLPPFIERDLEDEAILARFELSREELAETLFTRLAQSLPLENRITLSQQHRMQPDIGNLISRVFYGGRLRSPARAVDPIVQSCMGAPVTWLDTSGRSDRQERVRGTTIENRTEAKIIVDEVLKLNRLAELSDQPVRKIALLSGYEAQAKLLTDLLAPHRLSLERLDVYVATIDSFQGQEADICYFSLARSNHDGDIGFLRSAPRLNVALSRARDGLVIVGDSSMVRGAASARKSALAEVWRYVETEKGCIVREAQSA